MKDLVYRTYVFVERHLSPIDKGIQASHAVIEYYNEAKLWNKIEDSKNFDKWAHFDKTLILLDGGTVNDLNDLCEFLSENGIHHGPFAEEDLDNILTAVAIVVDERVFNRKSYPDYEEWLLQNKNIIVTNKTTDSMYYYFDTTNGCFISESEYNSSFYKEWLDFIGGKKNEILRNLIKNKKLAR